MTTRLPNMTPATSGAFREEDIRPDRLMHEAVEAELADRARMLSRRAEFIRVACPGCGSRGARRLFSKDGFDYEQCPDCETFYINPRPSSPVLEWYLGDSASYAHWNAYVYPAVEEARRKHIVAPRVDRLLALCDASGATTESLLEIGAAFGTFCLEAASRGRFDRIVAMEPTPGLAQTCRARGLETIEQSCEAYAASANMDRFDIVACFEVIEHLFSPRQFLQSAHRILRPRGLLVLTCPNGQGFDIQLLGKLSESVNHEHLNYFSPRSLGRLLVDCDFEVLDVSTPGRLDAELVRKKTLSGDFDLSAQPFLRRVLIEEWDRLGAAFQDFLAGNGLSSNMWVVARRAR